VCAGPDAYQSGWAFRKSARHKPARSKEYPIGESRRSSRHKAERNANAGYRRPRYLDTRLGNIGSPWRLVLSPLLREKDWRGTEMLSRWRIPRTNGRCKPRARTRSSSRGFARTSVIDVSRTNNRFSLSDPDTQIAARVGLNDSVFSRWHMQRMV